MYLYMSWKHAMNIDHREGQISSLLFQRMPQRYLGSSLSNPGHITTSQRFQDFGKVLERDATKYSARIIQDLDSILMA